MKLGKVCTLLILIGLLSIVISAIPGAEAEIKVWTGSSNQIWSIPSNWNPSGVPTSDDTAYIPAGIDAEDLPIIYFSGQEAYQVQINGSSSLTMDGGTLNVTNQLRIESAGGVLDLRDDSNVLRVDTLYDQGTVNCNGASPEIHIHGELQIYNNLYPGQSEIIFDDSGPSGITLNSRFLNRLVVNNSALTLQINSNLKLNSTLGVHAGSIDLNGKKVIVDALTVSGSITMDHGDDLLIVKGDATINDGGQLTGDSGNLSFASASSQYVYFNVGSVVQFDSSHVTLFNGSGFSRLYNYSASNYLNDVVANTGNYFAIYTDMNILGTLFSLSDFASILYDGNVTAGNVALMNSGIFKVRLGGQLKVKDDLRIDQGTRLEVGVSSGPGYIDISDEFYIDGMVILGVEGGFINVTGEVWVNSTANATFGGGTLDARNSWTGIYGDINIESNSTVLWSKWYHFFSGSLWVSGQKEAKIKAGHNFKSFQAGSVFHAGHSTVYFFGTSNAEIDALFDYWNVVIAKDNATITVYRNGERLNVMSTLALTNGTFVVNEHKVIIDGDGTLPIGEVDHSGFIVYSGSLMMTNRADRIYVNAPVKWGEDASATVTNGVIYVNGSWEFMNGSSVSLGGTSHVEFGGEEAEGPRSTWAPIYSHSGSSSMNDVYFNRLPSVEGNYVHQRSTGNFVIGGDVVANTSFVSSHSHTMVEGSWEDNSKSPGVDAAVKSDFGNSSITVRGDMYIQEGAVYNFWGEDNDTSISCKQLNINGTMKFTTGQGLINADRVDIRGVLQFPTGNGTLNAGAQINVWSGGLVEMADSGELYINTSSYIYIYPGGEIRLQSDGAYMSMPTNMHLFGTLNCSGYAPEIHVGDTWYSDVSADFIQGNSVVHFEGSTYDAYSQELDFYDVVIDKGSSNFALSTGDLNCHDLNIESGTVDTDGQNLTVDGDLDVSGDLVMDEDVLIWVKTYMRWNAGATESINNGTIRVDKGFYMMRDSDVTLGGTNLLRFEGTGNTYWRNYQPGNTLNDVIISRDGNLTTEFGEDMFVSGNLTMDSPGASAYTIDGRTMFIEGWLLVNDGDMITENGGNITVNGTVECGDNAYIVVESEMDFNSLSVNGTLYLNGTGAVLYVHNDLTIPGSDIIFNANNTHVTIEEDLYVAGDGVVNMTGTGNYLLEVGRDILLYGLLNMTNDNAVAYVGDDLNLYGGSTLDCGESYEPEIHVNGWFDSSGLPSAVFSEGHSTLYMEGGDYQVIENDLDYWGIVINKTGTWCVFESGAAVPTMDSFFFVQEGEFKMSAGSINVSSMGDGFEHKGVDYSGFTVYDGTFEMINTANVLDVDGDVTWGPGSSCLVNEGTIYAGDDWEVISGSGMRFTGDNLVVFDSNTFPNIDIDESSSYFNNLTLDKGNKVYSVWQTGTQGLNVTDTLIIAENSKFETFGKSLEADTILLYDGAELNVSLFSSLYVWNELDTNDTSTFFMANITYAYICNFLGSADVWLGNGNLSIAEELNIDPSGYIYPGESLTYFDWGQPSSIRVSGSLFDVMVDKEGPVIQTILYTDLEIEGDLTILEGSFYTNGHDAYLGGNYQCTPDGLMNAASGDAFIFNSVGKQWIQSGGVGASHDLPIIRVENMSHVIVQNWSLEIGENLTVDENCSFEFETPSGTLTLGNDGVLNQGNFYIDSSGGDIVVEFYQGTHFWNEGDVVFDWGQPNNWIELVSSSPGTQWYLVDMNTANDDPYTLNVEVQDSDASLGETIYAGGGVAVDNGNNDNWVFSHMVDIDLIGLDGTDATLELVQYNDSVFINGSDAFSSWADEGSEALLDDEVVISANEERFYTEDTATWTVNSGINTSVMYYHQWKPDIILGGTDATHNVTAWYTALGGSAFQADRYTSWTKWIDNGTDLWFSKNATGSGMVHTNEDFTASPWNPVLSAFDRTVGYEANIAPDLTDGQMEPGTGNTTTTFRFSVNYTDDNNDAPKWVRVEIDGTNYTMTQTNPGDTDYTDGAEYEYETTLSGGDHDYRFYAHDGYEKTSTSVETTGEIVPEFGLLFTMTAVLLAGAVMMRRRRKEL